MSEPVSTSFSTNARAELSRTNVGKIHRMLKDYVTAVFNNMLTKVGRSL